MGTMMRLRWIVPLLVIALLGASVNIVNAAATVITTISFAPSRAGTLGANLTTNKLYVSRDDAPQAINVIDANTNAIIATVPGQGFHIGLSVNSATNRIYVSQQFVSSVRVIDGSTDTVITDIPIPSTQTVGLNALDPSLNRLYVLRPNDSDIAVVDTLTNTFAGAISSGCCNSGGAALAVDVATHRIYVANSLTNNVVVIDGSNPSFPTLATIPMPGGAFRVAVHANTHRVYITHQGLGTVSIVDGQPGSPTENAIVGSITVGSGPFGITVDSSNNRAYVARPAAQVLSVINTTSNTVVDTVSGVPDGSASLAVIPSLRRVYASDDGCKCVTVVGDLYNFTGFFQPVDNLPTFNRAKAGSAIPVKFSLGGNQGLNIFAPGSPSVALIPCGSTALVDDIEQTVTAGGSSLTYDATADQYVYVWKTDPAWAGTCRQLNVKLNDGTDHRANFNFVK